MKKEDIREKRKGFGSEAEWALITEQHSLHGVVKERGGRFRVEQLNQQA